MLSHLRHRPLSLLNAYHTGLLAYFLERLRDVPEGDGTLLDHTVILYGSSMSDSNLHRMYDVPTMVVGGPRAGITGGRHLRYAPGTPLANLQLALLEKVGVQIEQFGDSTARLSGL